MTCAFDKVVCPKGFRELLCYMQTAFVLCNYTTIISIWGAEWKQRFYRSTLGNDWNATIALCVHKRVSWEHNPLTRGFQFKKLQMGALSTSNNKGLKSLFKFSQILSSGFSSVKWIMLHTKRASSSYIDADFELFLVKMHFKNLQYVSHFHSMRGESSKSVDLTLWKVSL